MFVDSGTHRVVKIGRQLLHDGCIDSLSLLIKLLRSSRIDKLSLETNCERLSKILSLFLRSERDGLVRRMRLGGVLVVQVLVVQVLVVRVLVVQVRIDHRLTSEAPLRLNEIAGALCAGQSMWS